MVLHNSCRSFAVLTVLLAALIATACGGSDASTEADGDTLAASESGDEPVEGVESATPIDSPPAGQATVTVDGLDFTLAEPGALTCSISEESLTFSYRIGDNEVTLGGGLNSTGDGWIGNIALSIANPDGEQGPIGYYPAPGENGVLDGSLFTIEGSTVRFAGPMLKQPANDGSQPPPIDVGTGTVIASC